MGRGEAGGGELRHKCPCQSWSQAAERAALTYKSKMAASQRSRESDVSHLDSERESAPWLHSGSLLWAHARPLRRAGRLDSSKPEWVGVDSGAELSASSLSERGAWRLHSRGSVSPNGLWAVYSFLHVSILRFLSVWSGRRIRTGLPKKNMSITVHLHVCKGHMWCGDARASYDLLGENIEKHDSKVNATWRREVEYQNLQMPGYNKIKAFHTVRDF